MRIHTHFIIRQIKSYGKQASIFVLCVALSMLTLVSLAGFSNSVRESMMKDARELHGADITIHSHYPFSDALTRQIREFTDKKLISSARVYEFYSMAQTTDNSRSLLAMLKVVESGYPFYGRVELKSGRNFSNVLASGNIIVEQSVLDRLKVKVGDSLHIGDEIFTIADVVTREPDRPVNFFSFGPRIFITAADLAGLNLIQKGSRIHYDYFIKVEDQGRVDEFAKDFANLAVQGQERVETYNSSRSRVKRFFDNLLFFLNLIGILTLVLAGAGIRSSLETLLRQSESTIAVMKTFGATGRFITVHFIAIVALLGFVGTGAGLVAGYLLQLYLPILFRGILPPHISVSISWFAVVEGIVLGIMIVALFTFIPLRNLKYLKPSNIFRKEIQAYRTGMLLYLSYGIIGLFFIVLVIWQLEDVLVGLYFVAGLVILIGISTLIVKLILKILQNFLPASLVLRQALKGLFRPRNATVSIIVTLSVALAVIFSIYLIQANLNKTFIQSYPPDLPNVYFLDIQPDQKQQFTDILGYEPQYYPVIRARIKSINNAPVNREQELKRKSDNLAREFNLTYRDHLLEDEALQTGRSLFGNYSAQLSLSDEIPVSILDTVAEIGDIQMDDLIVFNIQGLPVKARVTSIRTMTDSKLRPFFYFVFPREILQNAPQTIFAATRIAPDKLGSLQNRIVSEMPNISVIDISQTITVLAAIMHKLSVIVQFFSLFSIAAGLLIVVSSIFATKLTRTREAVYYKVLGATSGFVLKSFTCENLIVALFCSFLATMLSHIGSWIICHHIFAIPYTFFVGQTLVMIIATVMLIVGIGLFSTFGVMKKKPVLFLREQAEE